MPCWPIPTSSQDKTAQHSARSTEAWEVQSGDMVFFSWESTWKMVISPWNMVIQWDMNGMSSLWYVFTGQIFNTLQSMGHFPYFSIAMIDCQRVKPTNTNFRQDFIRGAGYSWGSKDIQGPWEVKPCDSDTLLRHQRMPAFPILWRSLSDCKWHHKHIDPYLISYGSIMIYIDLYVSWATQFWPMPGRNSSWSARAASWTSPKEPFLSSDVAEVGEVGVINSEETAGVVDDFDWCWFLVDFIVITCIIIYTYIYILYIYIVESESALDLRTLWPLESGWCKFSWTETVRFWYGTTITTININYKQMLHVFPPKNQQAARAFFPHRQALMWLEVYAQRIQRRRPCPGRCGRYPKMAVFMVKNNEKYDHRP